MVPSNFCGALVSAIDAVISASLPGNLVKILFKSVPANVLKISFVGVLGPFITLLRESIIWYGQYMISLGIEVRMNSFQARMNLFQTRRNSFYAEGRLEWNHSSLE